MLTEFQNLLLSDSGKFAISLVKISHQTYNISLHYLVKCECQKSGGSIVINDKSQGSRAKHLSYDGVAYFITDLPINLLEKEFLKSANNWQSYRQDEQLPFASFA